MSERGAGRLGTIVGFLVLIAIGLAIWNLFPVFWYDYTFQDKMREICRSAVWNCKDDCVMDKLMKSARENYLDDVLKPGQCRISTGDNSRRISCEYERTVEIVPGYKRTFKFTPNTEQPLL